MIRVALTNLVLFLLPFIGYALYVWLRTGRLDPQKTLDDAPFYWLIAGGAACVVVGLVLLGTYQTGSPNAVYEPARYEDGVLKPGGFRDPAERTERR